jgi:hypothetical protein
MKKNHFKTITHLIAKTAETLRFSGFVVFVEK